LIAVALPLHSSAQPNVWDIGYGTPERRLEQQQPQKSRLQGFQYSMGVGFGALALSNARLDATGDQQFGFSIDGNVGYRFNRWLGVNLAILSGYTAFERTETVAKAAVDAGSWTSNAFVDVTEWGYSNIWRALLVSTASTAIYSFLLMTYLAVPVLLAASPFAALSYMALGPTVSGHFGNETIEGFVEAGAGGFFYYHPQDKGILPGVGPLFGVGLRWRWFGFGARLLWSPPGAQVAIDDIKTDVFALTTTARISW